LVPYNNEVEVSHELSSRLARTFSAFDEHGQFFDHRNRCNSLHTDWLTLLKGALLLKRPPRTRPFEHPGFVKNIAYLAPN